MLPMVESAAIMPPKFGIAELDIRPPDPPPEPLPSAPLLPVYQPGK